jgi:hypothetical protein
MAHGFKRREMWTQADTEERRYGDTGEDGHLMVKIVL